MNCQQIDKYIFAYCDHTLPPQMNTAIEEHLVQCKACRTLVHMTRVENELLIPAPDFPSLSDEFTSRVMQAVREKHGSAEELQRIAKRRRNQIRGLSALAASAAIVVLCLAFDIIPGQQPPVPENGNPKVAGQIPNSAKGLSGALPTKAPQRQVNDEQVVVGGAADRTQTVRYGKEEGTRTLKIAARDQELAPVAEEKSSTPPLQNYNAPSPKEAADINQSAPSSPDPGMIMMASRTSLGRVHPTNVPPAYELVEVNVEGDALVYVYKSADNNLVVSIKPGETKKADGMGVPPNPNRSCGFTSPVNSTCTTITMDDSCYTVTVTGDASLGDLQELAQELELEDTELDSGTVGQTE